MYNNVIRAYSPESIRESMMTRRAVFLCLALITPLFWLGAASRLIRAEAGGAAAISGIVRNGNGPLAGARVRVRATENMVLSGEDGRFTLSGLEAGVDVEVTAWADGYYVTSTFATPPAEALIVTLRPYHTQDHPSYEWADPLVGESACANCHPPILSQWSNNAHAAAIDNPRFFSLYNGTNVNGDKKTGPGYLNDFPGEAGNCAACHAPGAAVDAPLSTNMNDVRGQVTAGIHCDFCHKIGGVDLDEETGSVYARKPGVQSLHLLRPPAGDDIFFGPFDDVHDPDTYLPLVSESQYCAACHQFSFFDTPIYESYNEWLASPYPTFGVTCQDCHMPPTGDSYFALPEEGGVARDPDSIPSHLQLGDNRIPALSYATSSYAFLLPQGVGDVQVTADLTYRFQFADLMDQKDWERPDIISATISRNQSFTPQWVVFAPLVKNR